MGLEIEFSKGWSVGSLFSQDDVTNSEGEYHTEPVVSRKLFIRDHIFTSHFSGEDSESRSCITADGYEPGLTALGLNWWDLLSADIGVSALNRAHQGAKYKTGNSH